MFSLTGKIIFTIVFFMFFGYMFIGIISDIVSIYSFFKGG